MGSRKDAYHGAEESLHLGLPERFEIQLDGRADREC